MEFDSYPAHRKMCPCQACALQKLYEQHCVKPIHGLQNAVHPLFVRDKFSKKVDYEALLPSLQLLTRLLRTPQLLHFFGTVFFGDLVDLGVPDKYDNLRAYRGEAKVHQLSCKSIEMIEEKLLTLAKMVRYDTRTPYNAVAECLAWGCTMDSMGVCRPYRKSPGYEFGLLGNESRIFISRLRHRELVKVHKKFLATGEDNLQFRFVITCNLLHELGHAASQAMAGRDHLFEDGKEVSQLK